MKHLSHITAELELEFCPGSFRQPGYHLDLKFSMTAFVTSGAKCL